MDIFNVTGQVAGIVAMIFLILSYQCRKTRNLYIMQGVSGILYSVNFVLLGTYTAALMNIISILRNFLLSTGEKGRKWYFLVMIILINTVATIFTYDGWLSLLTFSAQIVGTAAMWTNNGKTIRIWQFFFVSPAWLTHNIIVKSIGAIIGEAFSLASIIVYAVRCAVSGISKKRKEEN